MNKFIPEKEPVHSSRTSQYNEMSIIEKKKFKMQAALYGFDLIPE